MASVTVLLIPKGVLSSPKGVLLIPEGVLPSPISVLPSPKGVLLVPISVLPNPKGVLLIPKKCCLIKDAQSIHRICKSKCKTAVLVAIAIPVFTAQLEKSRESTDAANARSAYAEMMASAITDEELNTTANGSYTIATTGTAGARTYTATIPCKQMQNDWQNTSIGNIGGLTPPKGVGSGKSIVITYVQDKDTLSIDV